MKPPKLIHIRNGKRNFIRFGGKPKMIIEVWQFDNREDMFEAIETTQDEMNRIGLDLYYKFDYQDAYYLFVVTQFLNENDARKLLKIDDTLIYIANWYIHQCIKLDL
jgi:hypothetical protein